MCPRVTSPFSPAPVQSEKREWLASLNMYMRWLVALSLCLWACSPLDFADCAEQSSYVSLTRLRLRRVFETSLLELHSSILYYEYIGTRTSVSKVQVLPAPCSPYRCMDIQQTPIVTKVSNDSKLKLCIVNGVLESFDGIPLIYCFEHSKAV